eukprot:TRINITY_DN83058_c0_g1_i1.p1 TRINITY_DN83058_c0_g1~~TRINITY_DN83058_c0_g1_i1.p1  ORF type:complete len:162 (-),score=25.27 TRINITY_DN83058_c0_g1_i1:27-512(-)
MPHCKGRNHRTRSLFKKTFRQHGNPSISTYLQQFRRGDHVTIKLNSAVQRGMSTKHFHGKTGTIFNVTPRAVGVMIARRVGNKRMIKKVSVRIEHVVKSRCNDDVVKRIEKQNELAKSGVKGVAALTSRRHRFRNAHIIKKTAEPVEIQSVGHQIEPGLYL